MVYTFLDKKSTLLADISTSGSAIKNEDILNKESAEELHKTITRKFKKRKVHSTFIDNICGADLPDMQLITKFNIEFSVYCVLLIFSVNMHGLFL